MASVRLVRGDTDEEGRIAPVWREREAPPGFLLHEQLLYRFDGTDDAGDFVFRQVESTTGSS
jgi:hypothetical protein